MKKLRPGPRLSTLPVFHRMASEVAVSAPGKVLIAGGYLVLDRNYTGLVFGLDARIHVHVQELPPSEDSTPSEIAVQSPQFREAEWRYEYRQTNENGGIEVSQSIRQVTITLSWFICTCAVTKITSQSAFRDFSILVYTYNYSG